MDAEIVEPPLVVDSTCAVPKANKWQRGRNVIELLKQEINDGPEEDLRAVLCDVHSFCLRELEKLDKGEGSR